MIKQSQRLAAIKTCKCPVCGGELKDNYIELDRQEQLGWGALWCAHCKSAIALSRVLLRDDELRRKIVAELPPDLHFV